MYINLRYLVLATLLLFSSSGLLAQVDYQLSEKKLKELIYESSPDLEALKIALSAKEAQKIASDAKFGGQLGASFSYQRSNEKPVIQFSPTFKPAQLTSFAYSRRLDKGLSLQAELFSEQYTTADKFIDEATRVGTRISLEVDLRKNFWGRLDQLELKDQRLAVKRQKLENTLRSKELEIELRKLYWSIVANQMSQDLSRKLLDSSRRQYEETQKRYRQGAADKGELTRNKAQMQSREARSLFFEHQKNLLESRLKQFLPELDGKNLVYADRNIGKQEELVATCISEILTKDKSPFEFSSYPELIKLLAAVEKNSLEKSNWLDRSDLKLKTQIQQSNANKGYADSFGNYLQDSSNGVSLALEYSYPLNPKLSSLASKQKSIARLQRKNETKRLEALLDSEHVKISQSLMLLSSAMNNLSGSIENLETSLKESEKKYRQARIGLSNLIFEQDNFFNSKLQEIDTKHQIIHLVYDYFKTFDTFPCSVNRL